MEDDIAEMENVVRHSDQEHTGYVEFRCDAEPDLYIRYDPRYANGFIPRTGELVDIPPIWEAYGRYRVVSVETMLTRDISRESRQEAEELEEKVSLYGLPNTYVVRVTCNLVKLADPAPLPPQKMLIQ